ncbi:MAG TPA: 4-alpha-glucanotransferase [Jatrophihabitans sp.]
MTDALRELAGEYGVAVEYWDWRNQHVHVSDDTLVRVLAALDVDASTSESCAAALDARRTAPWRRVLAPYVVVRNGEFRTVDVQLGDGQSADVWITLEDGSYHSNLQRTGDGSAPREIDGRWMVRSQFALPTDLPLGYHLLHAYTAGEQYDTTLIVTPAWLGMPARVGSQKQWGLATQLYSVRSRRSWGIGDLTDLTDLAVWSAVEHAADFVLVNPLHAAESMPPMQPSPYLPTSRRFGNPIYLRIDRIPEYARLDLNGPRRAAVDAFRVDFDNRSELIDRDSAWTAKRVALELIHRVGLDPGRATAYRSYCRREGRALDDFATWCALAETCGPDWHDWPEQLRHPRDPAVAEFATGHEDEIDFHRWLQWVLDEQLAEAQAAVRRYGMALGIMHDLAVGVSPTGADSWTFQDEMARDIRVGAPPDAYAQTGQDWNQPPWRPDRLAELGYAPFRDLIANTLRHSGGLRVDHVIGLFRLWWVPAGKPATEGTYVRYDHDAAIGILALEAARAGAVVVGEDLGTVEPWARDYLRTRGIFGTSVLWFEFDYDGGGGPLAPERWREYCLASVTTHDLPPTAGYLAGDHVRLRNDLGLLVRSLEEEVDSDRVEQEAWLSAMRDRGLLAPDADRDETVVALYRALGFSPSLLCCLALTDAVGDRRTQNQPGATTGYPNWRMPLAGPDGEPVLLEDVFTSNRAARLAEIMHTASDSHAR